VGGKVLNRGVEVRQDWFIIFINENVELIDIGLEKPAYGSHRNRSSDKSKGLGTSSSWSLPPTKLPFLNLKVWMEVKIRC